VLDGLDIGTVLPDFAGFRLDGLFPGFKMPQLSNERVKVTHGFDAQRRRGWVRAAIPNLSMVDSADGRLTIFSFQALALNLVKPIFDAVSEVRVEEGATRKFANGTITGDWELVLGSSPLVTLRETKIEFDDKGKLNIDISPKNVEMTGVLKFLSEAMSSLGYSDGGFTVRLREKNGIPTGAEAMLDLALPDVAAGAFALSGLRILAAFRLNIDIGNPTNFSLEVAAGLGRKTAPFSLTIMLLAGGGYFEAKAKYYPLKKRLESEVSIGIVAGAHLGFALGPLKGSVSVFFGIEATFSSVSGSGSSFAVGIMLLIQGEVQVLGYVSISIAILLEARYEQGGRVVARGSISIKIKIFWFLTVKFSTQFSYTLAKGNHAMLPADGLFASLEPALLVAPPTHAVLAGRYVDLFR
jgi:hypothetical protein